MLKSICELYFNELIKVSEIHVLSSSGVITPNFQYQELNKERREFPQGISKETEKKQMKHRK